MDLPCAFGACLYVVLRIFAFFLWTRSFFLAFSGDPSQNNNGEVGSCIFDVQRIVHAAWQAGRRSTNPVAVRIDFCGSRKADFLQKERGRSCAR